MAKIGKNIVTTGLSGKLGLIVFRNRGGKTFESTAPEIKERELTPAQVAHQKKFQEAVLYGKSIMADTAQKAAYDAAAQNGQSAFNVAVADFMNAPSIEEIDLSKYTGLPGSIITIRVVDDFKVAEVQVLVHNSDGTLIENGLAIQQPNGIDWLFAATVNNVSLQGDRVTIRASDTPGNLVQSVSNI